MKYVLMYAKYQSSPAMIDCLFTSNATSRASENGGSDKRLLANESDSTCVLAAAPGSCSRIKVRAVVAMMMFIGTDPARDREVKSACKPKYLQSDNAI